jgi:hypothetical protein
MRIIKSMTNNVQLTRFPRTAEKMQDIQVHPSLNWLRTNAT